MRNHGIIARSRARRARPRSRPYIRTKGIPPVPARVPLMAAPSRSRPSVSVMSGPLAINSSGIVGCRRRCSPGRPMRSPWPGRLWAGSCTGESVAPASRIGDSQRWSFLHRRRQALEPRPVSHSTPPCPLAFVPWCYYKCLTSLLFRASIEQLPLCSCVFLRAAEIQFDFFRPESRRLEARDYLIESLTDSWRLFVILHFAPARGR